MSVLKRIFGFPYFLKKERGKGFKEIQNFTTKKTFLIVITTLITMEENHNVVISLKRRGKGISQRCNYNDLSEIRS